MTARILRADQDGLCTLSLNRSDKLNTLDTQTFEELDGHLGELENCADRIGCVVIRGAGRAFCAGADLNALGAAALSPALKPGVIARLAQLPQPVIAAVHGVCYTGGLELALACDFIVADAGARFADTHGRWGLVSQRGMGQRLPRRVGIAVAKRLMMTGVTVDADEAVRIGLVDVLVASGELDAAIAGLAGQILANSWHTMAVKQLLIDTDGMSLAEGLAHENLHHPGFASDYRERIERFGRKQR